MKYGWGSTVRTADERHFVQTLLFELIGRAEGETGRLGEEETKG